MKEKEIDTEHYLLIHNLVYEYQNGSEEAASKLLLFFTKFFTNYAMLIKFGKFNISYFSIRNFVKLFIENKKERNTINKYSYYNFSSGKKTVSRTIKIIESVFQESTYDDIINDLKTIFLIMCKKYKDTKPTFHIYINRTFHFNAYRYWEKRIRDPIGRGSSVSIFDQMEKDSCQKGIKYADIITSEEDNVETEKIINNINAHYIIEHSSMPIIKTRKKDIYDNEFIDENWVNGVSCENDAFKILTPLERKIIKYWYIDNLTDTEISNIIGLCRGNINKRRNIAKQKIIDYCSENKKKIPPQPEENFVSPNKNL